MHTRASVASLLLLLVAIVGASAAEAQVPPCSPDERREVLRALQRQVLELLPRQLDSLDEAIRPGGSLAGWRLTHGHVVMAHSGAVPVGNIIAKAPLAAATAVRSIANERFGRLARL